MRKVPSEKARQAFLPVMGELRRIHDKLKKNATDTDIELTVEAEIGKRLIAEICPELELPNPNMECLVIARALIREMDIPANAQLGTSSR